MERVVVGLESGGKRPFSNTNGDVFAQASACFSGRRAGRFGWSDGTTQTNLDLACPLQAFVRRFLQVFEMFICLLFSSIITIEQRRTNQFYLRGLLPLWSEYCTVVWQFYIHPATDLTSQTLSQDFTNHRFSLFSMTIS